MSGRLTIFTGAVGSGKTAALLREYDAALASRRTVVLVQHRVTERPFVETHDGTRRVVPTLHCEQLREIDVLLWRNDDDAAADDAPLWPPAATATQKCALSTAAAVFVDELQFFLSGEHAAANLRWLRECTAAQVYASGIDADYRGAPFGLMPQAIAAADCALPLAAVCYRCGRRDAYRSVLLKQGDGAAAVFDGQILVGRGETFRAVCAQCIDY
jgi:thymidine kinase